MVCKCDLAQIAVCLSVISQQVDLGFEALRYLTGYREALKEVRTNDKSRVVF